MFQIKQCYCLKGHQRLHHTSPSSDFNTLSTKGTATKFQLTLNLHNMLKVSLIQGYKCYNCLWLLFPGGGGGGGRGEYSIHFKMAGLSTLPNRISQSPDLCLLSPDFERYLLVSRFMSVISRIIKEVCYFVVDSTL